jgi:hypothetical protein
VVNSPGGRSVRVAAISLLTGRDGRHNPGIGSRPHGLYFPGDDANDAAHKTQPKEAAT